MFQTSSKSFHVFLLLFCVVAHSEVDIPVRRLADLARREKAMDLQEGDWDEFDGMATLMQECFLLM
jgi:hypothetical protein